MINIDKNEITVNLNALTQLQAQLLADITNYAAAHTDPTPAQLLAASEKCAVDSYGARTMAGPSGELAAVYRAIGRALIGRPVEVIDVPLATPVVPSSRDDAPQWRRVGATDVLDLDLFFLSAGESGEWSVETHTSHAVRALGSGFASSMRSARLAALDAGLALLSRMSAQIASAPHDK